MGTKHNYKSLVIVKRCMYCLFFPFVDTCMSVYTPLFPSVLLYG